MKIKCEFCGSMINDTEQQCPNCGAPNPNVRRSSGDQPLTISQLQQWYESKGLPPYEVTRFFIGQDIRDPKAFGIYYDDASGNYIVYKNKDTGERAIRYQGTDEAYAVNELFQRLKQEIIQQKMHNVKKGQAASGTTPVKESKSGCLGNLLALLLICVGGIAALFVLIVGLGFFLMRNDPSTGYYTYSDTTYYYSSKDYNGLNWFRYDDAADTWEGPLSLSEVPDSLETKKSGKQYYLQSDWDSTIACGDFNDSVFAQDLSMNMSSQGGYYEYDAVLYYHLPEAFDEGWYHYKGQWRADAYSDLPQTLQHPSTATQYFLSEEYHGSYGGADFADTLFYRDYSASPVIAKGYYQVENTILYHLGDYYDEGWYTYEDDEWQSIDETALPEELHHPSLAEDFYFTPTWDASTQFTDFTDTDFYQDASKKWDNDDDRNDYNWDSNDSWDSGDTDWGSDW